ncbi:MAG: hypothetical protein HC884_02930 [Chloroflexaceae bacterium]|nr:hypothetical protein [Chloroflexaceae bacterium]
MSPSLADDTDPSSGRPQIIFFTDQDEQALRHLLMQEGVLDDLAEQRGGLALAILELNEGRADIVRLLNARGISTVAWLLLPPEEGYWFNLQNYPQAVERYRAFHAWSRSNQLHFDAVGLDIEPPEEHLPPSRIRKIRKMTRRFWGTQEYMIYLAACSTYNALIAEMHRDGYEVHTYQLPLLVDDRRAGTTLLQRALNIVDLPSDLEVLLCSSSSLPGHFRHDQDIGGSLIASYGPSADGIGIGSTRIHPERCLKKRWPPLSWDELKREVLLAARYTDMIYLFSFEGCVEQGWLSRLKTLDWNSEWVPPVLPSVQFETMRTVLFVALLLTRFYRTLLAWLGWGVAAVLLLQRVRSTRRESYQERERKD